MWSEAVCHPRWTPVRSKKRRSSAAAHPSDSETCSSDNIEVLQTTSFVPHGLSLLVRAQRATLKTFPHILNVFDHFLCHTESRFMIQDSWWYTRRVWWVKAGEALIISKQVWTENSFTWSMWSDLENNFRHNPKQYVMNQWTSSSSLTETELKFHVTGADDHNTRGGSGSCYFHCLTKCQNRCFFKIYTVIFFLSVTCCCRLHNSRW